MIEYDKNLHAINTYTCVVYVCSAQYEYYYLYNLFLLTSSSSSTVLSKALTYSIFPSVILSYSFSLLLSLLLLLLLSLLLVLVKISSSSSSSSHNNNNAVFSLKPCFLGSKPQDISLRSCQTRCNSYFKLF